MKIFNAAVWTNSYGPGQNKHCELEEHEQQKVINAVRGPVLESYHYIKKGRYVEEIRNEGGKIFLDSGAFSAYNIGVEINIDEYCDFVKQNSDIFKVDDGILMVSILDGIGDPLKTWQNQHYMEKQGIKPLPCFHYCEDERYLDWYIKNYDYITIGGLVGKSKVQVINWLDKIWSDYLCDSTGKPRIKVHAFGVTSIDLIERYPWYSVDSSLWIQSASFGMIVTKEFRNISISDKSPSRHNKGQHIDNFSETERKAILAIIEKAGFNKERLSETYQSRVAYNLYSMGEIMKVCNEKGCNMDFMRIQGLF